MDSTELNPGILKKTVMFYCSNQSTADLFEVADFFFYYLRRHAELFGKASDAEKLFCIAINQTAVNGGFVAFQQLAALLAICHKYLCFPSGKLPTESDFWLSPVRQVLSFGSLSQKTVPTLHPGRDGR